MGLSGGCKEPSPPPATSHGDDAESTSTRHDLPAEGCRDWSAFDVSSLAPLVGGEHAALLDQVWRIVVEKHFDPTLGCLDWGALRLVYAEKIAEAKDDAQAYAVIGAMLDELEHSHLRLFPPVRQQDAPGPVAPDLRVRWVEDQLVVVRSNATGPQGSVLPGATVRAIGEHSVDAIAAQVRARYEPHEFPRRVAALAAARMSCEREGQHTRLEVTNPAKDHRNAVRIVPCVPPPGERITLGNLRDVPTTVEHQMLPGTAVGVLRFNVWMLPMVKRVEAAMTDLRAQGMQALVLDLRDNPGGVGAMAVPVARMLLEQEGSLGTMRFRDFEQELNVEPGDKPFTGPVAILVDESTASTSEIFVLGMRELGRVTVVGGQRSAGAALPSVIEEVQGGALLQVAVADYHSPRGTAVEGVGVEPDVLVVETRDAFAQGRDPVLEAARDHLLAQLERVDAVASATGGEEPGAPESAETAVEPVSSDAGEETAP